MALPEGPSCTFLLPQKYSALRQCPRRAGASRERTAHPGILALNLLLNPLAHNGNLRKARTDVVVEVCCDSGTNPLELKKTLHTISIERVDDDANQHCCKHEKPPTLPDSGQDRE